MSMHFGLSCHIMRMPTYQSLLIPAFLQIHRLVSETYIIYKILPHQKYYVPRFTKPASFISFVTAPEVVGSIGPLLDQRSSYSLTFLQLSITRQSFIHLSELERCGINEYDQALKRQQGRFERHAFALLKRILLKKSF